MENTSDLIAGAVSGLGYMFGGAYGEESFSWIQGGEPAGGAVQIPSGSTAAGAPVDGLVKDITSVLYNKERFNEAAGTEILCPPGLALVSPLRLPGRG